LRYALGTPTAAAAAAPGTVYLRNDLKAQLDGNTYVIEYLAMTNCNSDLTNDPAVISYNADLATNRWPFRRMHIDLSIDGGETYPRRIGYAVSAGGPFGELIWSPPEDYALLTTNARLRLCTLDGSPFGHRGDGKPYDVPTNTFLISSPFSIVGASITDPPAGELVYAGFPLDLTWVQAGAGAVMRLYWITPESVGNSTNQLIETFTNCVEGTNVRTVIYDLPPAEQMKLVLVSQSDPNLIGYSGSIWVEP
jgi:hypothetical protein